MGIVLLFFWGVCVFRLSPEIAPKHPWIAMMVLAANLFVGITTPAIFTEELPIKIATGVFVSTAAAVGLLRLACQLRGFSERFMQTMITWLGCDMVLTAMFGLTMGISNLLQAPSARGVVFLGALFAIWSVAVLGFILSKALNLHRVLGVGFAFTILLMSAGLGMVASGG